MGAPSWLAPLQALVENGLPAEVEPGVAGLIGDHPSTYSRSPRIWTPALAALGIPATYLPLDLPPDRLPAFMTWMRETSACLGVNVTSPHKGAVIPYLDEVDATAQAVGAVNTIVRFAGARLAGTNTDAAGLLAALRHDDGEGAVAPHLDGITVLLIGAGGAARAAAMALGSHLRDGDLLIVNRHAERAGDLADRLRTVGRRATVVSHDDLDGHLPDIGLVINASLCGQAGILKRPEGWTCLEPYSALAPANPAVLPPMPEDEFYDVWSARSAADIESNRAASRERVRRLPRSAAVYDMIYAPIETVTMRSAREAGRRAANGRWMNIAQAVESFIQHLCRPILDARGIDRQDASRRVEDVMARAWDQ